MKNNLVSAAFVAFVSCVPVMGHTTLITIDPTSDGSLYTCPGCNVVSDGAYVLVSGYIQGVVKFSSTAIDGDVDQALLTLNPYGLPLFGPQVDVYGYGTSEGQLVVSDANAGVFIGLLTLPSNLGYGEDVFFDVTSFVASTNAPFLAFNLRSAGTDVFSSLEYNYGHPSQLLVTIVPEPESAALLLAGLFAIAANSRYRSAKRRHAN